ncbi:UDP-GalNAc:beta-1,3-N-acetylgalactosaminyltransferase 1 [Elgaria multicarinata webbii]|uniref:UDP-GalNAc:beta-1, 3-N-acetylgalactosaminyltransferase 1 n=1 Tax=Elgaria multicarinata webbii TaxID=159646 RepID=UPI002FCCCAA4
MNLKTAMSMTCLKYFFFGLTVISVVLMTWFMVFSSHTGIEHIDYVYFYSHEPVYKQNFLFTLRERLKCEDNKPFLVILVTSRPTDVKVRQAIRKTWGSEKSWWGNKILTLFLLGKGEGIDDNAALSIEDESILYGDILQQDFLDTYSNLTLKTVMAFRWLTEFCSNAQYVMKTDSDVFINMGNLMKLLNSSTSENFITGYPLIEKPAHRGFYWKTFISFDEYPFKVYPPYLSGLGYVLDTGLAQQVYGMMSHVKPIKFEDVYVGICLGILGVNITVLDDVDLFFLYPISFDSCKYKHLIAVHGISPQEMLAFWQEITRETSIPCH